MVDHFQPFSMVGSFRNPFSLGHSPAGQGPLRAYEPQGNRRLMTIKAKTSLLPITHTADYATRIQFFLAKGNREYNGCFYCLVWVFPLSFGPVELGVWTQIYLRGARINS